VMQVLENHPDAPSDLRQKSLRLAGRIIECSPDVRGGDGFGIACDILDSGRALAQMQTMIDAQGNRHFDHHHPPLSALRLDVLAPRSGVVVGIDNLQIARIARLAGAPKVIGAGIDLFAKLGDQVAEGDPLYRIYASYPADLAFARQALERANGYLLGSADQLPQVFVEF